MTPIDLAVAVAQRRVPPVAEDGAPVPGDDLAHRVGLGIARHRAAQQLHHVLAAGRRDQEVVRVHTDHLGTAVSEDALGGPVPLEDAQVGIHDEARDRHALELELQARQLRAVGRLGRLGRPGRLGRESGPGAHLRGQLLGRDREQAGRHPLGHLVDGRRLVGSPPSLSTFPHPAATLLLLRGTPSRPGSTCRQPVRRDMRDRAKPLRQGPLHPVKRPPRRARRFRRSIAKWPVRFAPVHGPFTPGGVSRRLSPVTPRRAPGVFPMRPAWARRLRAVRKETP